MRPGWLAQPPTTKGCQSKTGLPTGMVPSAETMRTAPGAPPPNRTPQLGAHPQGDIEPSKDSHGGCVRAGHLDGERIGKSALAFVHHALR
jgi:hypothetical protein